METFALSPSRFELAFQASDRHFHILKWGADGYSWLNRETASGLFSVTIMDKVWDVHNLLFEAWSEDKGTAGMVHGSVRFAGDGFGVTHHVLVYADSSLIEQWQEIRATEGGKSVTRLDSFSLNIPPNDYDLLSFTSAWGQEFEPERVRLQADVILEGRKGRSSSGRHPFFALFAGREQVLSGSVAWSGNWVCRFEQLADGGFRLSGGLHDHHFQKDLMAGETLESPRVVLATGHDLNAASQQYARVGRRYWYPKNALSETLPVEWNHWWSYEDKTINQTVFQANAQRAAEIGVEICTLDAGWFGEGSEWYPVRGDWEVVNRQRFPDGIRDLSEMVHGLGMRFGLWCEIEGLGAQAELARTHTDFPALRDGVPLGYVCLGNPAAQEWAFQTLSRLIRDYQCDWIKLDFNLDPESGCNRSDHGHQVGDGLYEHYRSYYRLLERVRGEFPEVIFENCSSGGLRIDLGILRRTHLTFLSDPDWPVHSLQVFWGATTMLAPNACLHWSYSEWLGDHPPQRFNPRDPNLLPHQFDTYTRIAMLGAFGFSQKLPDLPDWVARRLAEHIRIYQQHVRRFVRDGDLYRLTDQPRRDGTGDRWCAFQYSLPDKAEHLLFVFRLPGGEAERAVRLADLEPEGIYRIEGFEGEKAVSMTGQALMEKGLVFTHLREEESALLRLV
jgi:alpha-galactosidase